MSDKLNLLESYQKIRHNFNETYKEVMPEPKKLWYYQELVYRINIFEVLQLYLNAVPLTTDMDILRSHYLIMDAYIENIKNERNLPKSSKQEVQKERETALTALTMVIDDYRKRFSSYTPQSPEQYQKDIKRTVGTALLAWVQYRNTVNEIKIMEEQS